MASNAEENAARSPIALNLAVSQHLAKVLETLGRVGLARGDGDASDLLLEALKLRVDHLPTSSLDRAPRRGKTIEYQMLPPGGEELIKRGEEFVAALGINTADKQLHITYTRAHGRFLQVHIVSSCNDEYDAETTLLVARKGLNMQHEIGKSLSQSEVTPLLSDPTKYLQILDNDQELIELFSHDKDARPDDFTVLEGYEVSDSALYPTVEGAMRVMEIAAGAMYRDRKIGIVEPLLAAHFSIVKKGEVLDPPIQARFILADGIPEGYVLASDILESANSQIQVRILEVIEKIEKRLREELEQRGIDIPFEIDPDHVVIDDSGHYKILMFSPSIRNDLEEPDSSYDDDTDDGDQRARVRI